jgi:hypothetical protein
MKNPLFSIVFMLAIVQVQAQCKIASVKEGSSRLEISLEGGSSTFVQWNKKDVYDYSSCWMGVAQRLSGTIYVYLYDGSRNTSQKSIQFSSGYAKSIKIIGNKVKVLYDDGKEDTKNIN